MSIVKRPESDDEKLIIILCLAQFWTLRYVDPATYQILGNLKIVTTGVLFRLLLQRRLSMLQWIALVLLMIGATTSQVRSQPCSFAARTSRMLMAFHIPSRTRLFETTTTMCAWLLFETSWRVSSCACQGCDWSC